MSHTCIREKEKREETCNSSKSQERSSQLEYQKERSSWWRDACTIQQACSSCGHPCTIEIARINRARHVLLSLLHYIYDGDRKSSKHIYIQHMHPRYRQTITSDWIWMCTSMVTHLSIKLIRASQVSQQNDELGSRVSSVVAALYVRSEVLVYPGGRPAGKLLRLDATTYRYIQTRVTYKQQIN